MRFEEFAYMRWAKTVGRRGRIRLTASGMPEWRPDELSAFVDARALALGPDDDDHPAVIRAAVARAANVPEACVFVTASASHAAALVFLALLAPGDDVLVESPGYESFTRLAEFAGAGARTLPRRPEDAFAVDPGDLARSLRANTRMVVLSDLHNPSGRALSAAERDACAALLEQHGAWLFVDEAYLGFAGLAAGLRTNFAPGTRRIAVSSVTKAHGLGGLRLGWVLAPEDVIARLVRLNDLFVVHPPFPSAAIAAFALEHPAPFQERLDRVAREQRPRVADFVARRAGRGVSATLPEHGPVAFLRLDGVTDARPFAERLLARHGVNVTPGCFFGAPDHVRIGFARVAAAPLDEALGAFEECLDRT